MKSKKLRIGALAMALLIGGSMFQSCKKGENDPFLSFKSRDGRITGEWELKTYHRETTTLSSSGGVSVTSSTVRDYVDKIETVTVDGTFAYTQAYSENITIEKGGSYTYVGVDIDDNETEEYTGSWHWIDNNKKKTGIQIDGTYEVDRLTNKELVLKTDSYSKDTDTNGDVYEYTSESTYTYAKK